MSNSNTTRFFQIQDNDGDPYTAGYDGNVFGSKAEAKRVIKLLNGEGWHVAELEREEALRRSPDLVAQYEEA